MRRTREKYTVEPFPPMRRFAVDAGYISHRKHIIHGLLEVDITEARNCMRAHRERTGERLSLTAFVVNCLGKAVESNRHVQAYLNWRNQLVIFEDVNVNTMIEVDMDGRKVPVPHILKSVNKRTFLELHEEIRAFQARPQSQAESNLMRWFLRLPAFLRRMFYWVVLRMPTLLRDRSSSVMVTAVGMFAGGGGWGIPSPSFTLTVTLGGIVKKPGVVDGEIAIREYLDMTISIDHDVVDGAPATRFVRQFRELLEGCYGLAEPLQ